MDTQALCNVILADYELCYFTCCKCISKAKVRANKATNMSTCTICHTRASLPSTPEHASQQSGARCFRQSTPGPISLWSVLAGVTVPCCTTCYWSVTVVTVTCWPASSRPSFPLCYWPHLSPLPQPKCFQGHPGGGGQTGGQGWEVMATEQPPPTPGGGSGAHHSSPAGTPYHSCSQSVSQATLGQGSLSCWSY